MIKRLTCILIIFVVALLATACLPTLPENHQESKVTQVNISQNDEHQQTTLELKHTSDSLRPTETTEYVSISKLSENPANSLQRSHPMTDTISMQSPSPGSPEQQAVANQVIKKLAAHISLPEESIKIISIRPALWRNSNLGCPSQGQKAAQKIISGYEIILEANGNIYTYHTDDTGHRAIICQPTQKATPTSKANQPPQTLILAVRGDLAQNLNIPIEKILFVFGEPHPCPDQDKSNTVGWRLVLNFQGKRFIYRICDDQIIPPQNISP